MQSMVGAHIPATHSRVRAHPSYRSRSGRSERAFSVVELLVVLVIVGLLIALVAPSLRNARRAPEGPGVELAAGSLWRAIGRYRADNRGGWPSAATMASISSSGTVSGASTAMRATLRGPSGEPYLQVWPTHPTDSARPIRVIAGSGTPAASNVTGEPHLMYASTATSGWLAAYDSRGKRRWCRSVQSISGAAFENGAAGGIAC